MRRLKISNRARNKAVKKEETGGSIPKTKETVKEEETGGSIPKTKEEKPLEEERKERSDRESSLSLGKERKGGDGDEEKKERSDSESSLPREQVTLKGKTNHVKKIEQEINKSPDVKNQFFNAARPKVTDGRNVEGLLEIQTKLQNDFALLIASDQASSGRPYRLGAVVIDGSALSHVTRLTPSHELIGDGAVFGEAHSSDLVELVDKTLRATGQLDLLSGMGILDDSNWRIVVDVDYYHNRTASSIGMHKDSTGRTMWVNLNYMNEKPTIGPEYIHNPNAFTSEHESFYLHHPRYKELKDEYRDKKEKNELGIEFLPSIDPFGILSFDDNLNHHSTPYLFSRGQPTIDTAIKAFERYNVNFTIAELYSKLKVYLESNKSEIIKPQDLLSGGLTLDVVLGLYGGKPRKGNEILETLNQNSDISQDVLTKLKKFLEENPDKEIRIEDLNNGSLSNEQIILLLGGQQKTGSQLFTNVESRGEYKHMQVLDLLKENRGDDETINLKDEALQKSLTILGISIPFILNEVDKYRFVVSNAGPNTENFPIPKGLKRSLSSSDILAAAKRTKAGNDVPRNFFRMWVGAYPIHELTPSVTPKESSSGVNTDPVSSNS